MAHSETLTRWRIGWRAVIGRSWLNPNRLALVSARQAISAISRSKLPSVGFARAMTAHSFNLKKKGVEKTCGPILDF